MKDYAMYYKVNEENKEKWQLVLASQFYGTFFCIYGMFIPSSDGNTLESIKFKLVNYKGIINLGILKDPYILPKNRSGKNIIVIPIKGMIDDIASCNISLNLPIEKTNLYFVTKLNPLRNPKSFFKSNVFDQEFYFRNSEQMIVREYDNELLYRHGAKVGKDPSAELFKEDYQSILSLPCYASAGNLIK